MEHTYSITDITPTLEEGGLVKLSFSAVATDELGNTATQAVTVGGGLPAPADAEAGYTDEELQSIAAALAASQNVYPHLDVLVASQRTPMYVAVPLPELTDDDKKTLWMAQIDANVASVYNQFTRFQTEYEQREKAAQDYKDAGYTGDATVWITSFADSNGISYQACADLVLSQAVELRNAVAALGELRMNKYKVKNAASIQDAEVEFNKIITAVSELAKGL